MLKTIVCDSPTERHQHLPLNRELYVIKTEIKHHGCTSSILEISPSLFNFMFSAKVENGQCIRQFELLLSRFITMPWSFVDYTRLRNDGHILSESYGRIRRATDLHTNVTGGLISGSWGYESCWALLALNLSNSCFGLRRCPYVIIWCHRPKWTEIKDTCSFDPILGLCKCVMSAKTFHALNM